MEKILSIRYIKHMFFLIVLIALSQASYSQELEETKPENVGMSSQRLERLNSALESYIQEEKIAGQVAIVLRDGQIVFEAANGFRDIASDSPMTSDTMFRIASQTKAIISIGIMILQEQGKLKINDPLWRYLPEWRESKVALNSPGGADPSDPPPLRDADRAITIRHLLTHTSGISYGGGPAQQQWEEADIQGWYFADREEPIRETVRTMATLPLSSQPGKRWVYGYNTDILGAVIEVASGMELDRFLFQHIFSPLEMNDTHFYVPREKADRLATVYQPKSDGIGIEAAPDLNGMQGQGMYVEGPRSSFSGGAGLISTARDYARFLQMTLNGGELAGNRLLSRKSIELMTTNHLDEIQFRQGQGFGLGFSVVTDLGARGSLGSEGEYGWGGAYHSTYWVDPTERLVVVYLTQIRPANGLNDYDALRNGVYQAIID
tara:strand:- start:9870 stop:11174 length:1305 start_codon:yes stop_codon:yes gene_type:complete